jgi:chromatin structure-remodeling complex protein RSC7
MRRTSLNGVYDPHTNIMQYPKTMQPTHARWEPVPDSALTTNAKAITANGSIPYEIEAHYEHVDVEAPEPSIFPPVKPIHARRFLIVDTLYENPDKSHLGVPGVDGDVHDIGFNGLSSVPDDIRNELPPECRQAFDDALTQEMEWKGRWSCEERDACRRAPIVDKGLFMM